jgi:hypothetical protein
MVEILLMTRAETALSCVTVESVAAFRRDAKEESEGVKP